MGEEMNDEYQVCDTLDEYKSSLISLFKINIAIYRTSFLKINKNKKSKALPASLHSINTRVEQGRRRRKLNGLICCPLCF